MAVAENKQIVLSMLAALSAGDYPLMLSYLSDDIQFYVIGTTKYSGLFNGKEEFWTKNLKPMVDQMDDNGFSEEIVKIIGEGDIVVTESRGRETLASGLEYNNEYAFIYRLRDGLIIEWNAYLDTLLIAGTHE